MKAWMQLILMCAMIITGALVTGCDGGSSGNRVNRVSQRSQQDNLVLNRMINDMKEYNCNLNQALENINQDAKIVCTELDTMKGTELAELNNILNSLKEKAVIAGRDQLKPQPERAKYGYLFDAVERIQKDIVEARGGLAEVYEQTREQRLERLDEIIDEKLILFEEATAGCLLVREATAIDCYPYVDDMVKEVEFDPSSSPSVIKGLEMRLLGYETLKKDLEKDIIAEMKELHKNDGDDRNSRNLDVMGAVHSELRRIYNRDLQRSMYEDMNQIKAAMVIISAVDMNTVAKGINQDLSDNRGEFLDLEIILPFDLEGVDNDLSEGPDAIVSDYKGDADIYGVDGLHSELSEVKRARPSDLEDLQAASRRLTDYITQVKAVDLRYESLAKNDSNGDAVSSKYIRRARYFTNFNRYIVRDLTRLQSAINEKIAEIKPAVASNDDKAETADSGSAVTPADDSAASATSAE